MLNRRGLLRTLATLGVAAVVVMGSVFADELLGVISKVDADAKKITVIEKGTKNEVVVEVNGDTEYVTKKGSNKLDLEKLERQVAKAQEKGRKGVSVKITHDKKVASKIEATPKKKDAAPAN
jgi:hypothetical protein